jgi:SAM-dependent methyltransferase
MPILKIRPGSFISRLPQCGKDLLLFLGFDLRLVSDDRRILEEIIFPFIVGRADFRRILFIGCDWYTAGYARVFKGREFWTLEIDSRRGRYGSAHHILDAAENVRAHFERESFDAIFCNGVFGCGLNEREQVDRAFRGFRECLRPDGLFVLGWNDTPERKPFSPESSADKFFSRLAFPPVKRWRWPTENPNEHTFDFYIASQKGESGS